MGEASDAMTNVPFIEPRSTTLHRPSASLYELGMTSRNAGIVVEGHLGMDVVVPTRPPDHGGRTGNGTIVCEGGGHGAPESVPLSAYHC